MDYKDLIAGNISGITGIEKEKVFELIEIPPRLDMGDFAFPCFTLAKTLRKAPPLIAQEIAADARVTAGAEEELKAAAVGPYLNFKLDRKVLARELITEIRTEGDNFGSSKAGEGRNVIVEFSSPNIAKPFHVGHAFTTILGDSISNIYAKLGYNVIRFNHLGDYGTQFGKLITAWRLWGDEKAMEKDAIEELTRIYVKFHQEAKNDETLEDTARDNFRKLEEGNEEEVALWKMFRDLSLEVFEKTYKRLGVKFDNYNGESFYSSRIPAVVDLLKDKGLLEESEGAQVVKFDEEGMPPCMILKSDGTTIYASRDLAAAIYRHDEFNFYRNIYVVGLPQQLHFRQVFGVLKKAGFDWADNCIHVGFGLLKFKDGSAFSTREGNIIKLDELLERTVEKTAEIIRKNDAERGGDMNFEGDTAPYLIYTYARTRSILRKAAGEGLAPSEGASLECLTGDEEYAVIRSLSDFAGSVERSAESYEPFVIAKQIALIARNFNRFYNNSRILNAETDELKTARLALCDAVCSVIKSGLALLGIGVVEKM